MAPNRNAKGSGGTAIRIPRPPVRPPPVVRPPVVRPPFRPPVIVPVLIPVPVPVPVPQPNPGSFPSSTASPYPSTSPYPATASSYPSETTSSIPAPTGASGSGSDLLASPEPESSKSNLGLYIGLPIGLIALAALVIFGVVQYKKRRVQRLASAESVGDIESQD